MPPTTRRIAAILVADVVGYSRLIERDDQTFLILADKCPSTTHSPDTPPLAGWREYRLTAGTTRDQS